MQCIRNCRSFVVTPSIQITRASSSTTTEQPAAIFVNRNPRNLERLRIGYKPSGYHVERPIKTYWHKLNLTVSGKYVTATVNHFENGEVLSASTKEWCIKKYLYKPKDTAAFINLGRILGFRCLQSGLTEVACDLEARNPDGKIASFLKALEDSGVQLQEPPQYKKPLPFDLERPEKPWEVVV